MNLKTIVVTTLIVAGAASSTAFADQGTQAQLDAMRAQIAQMQATINANNAGTNLPTAGWFNRITLGGILNVDAIGTSSKSPVNFVTSHPSALAVSSAALYADAAVSDWTNAHIGLAYGTSNVTTFNYLRPGAYTSSDATGSDGRALLDEAYLTIGNFAKSPFYLKAGKQYLPFGSYTPFKDITPSFTQVLSQVNDPAAVVGFVTNNGITGSVYALQGINKVNLDGSVRASTAGSKSAIRNYGLNLGVNNSYNDLGYNAGIGYLANMADVTGVAYALTNANATANGAQGYYKATPAVAANLGLKYRGFDAAGKYVTATQAFNAADVSYDGNGAKPAAWGVDAGYSFPILAHDSRFGLGYQGTKQAADLNMFGSAPNGSAGANQGGQSDFDNMGLPKTRYLANYTVNVSKYTDLGFEIRHDVDYSVANGGTGNSTNTGTARIAVKFA